jgi:DNA-binding GntR family transcriptional regulator
MQDGSPRNSVVKVVAALTELILTGQLPAGTPVREIDMANRLGVSRTPVREAISQLVSRGLLTKEGGRSARVHQPSLEDLIDIYELRTVTESYLAAKAAEAIDARTLGKLRKAEEKLRTTTGDEWFAHHLEFHNLISEAAHRPRFNALAATLKDQSEPYVRLVTKLDHGLQIQSATEHTALLAAMASADATAARELTEAHLQSTVDSVDRIFRAARGLLLPLGSVS